MTDKTGVWEVSRESPDWKDLSAKLLLDADWSAVDSLPAFQRSDGSAKADQQTAVQLVASKDRLCIRFESTDRDIWATMTDRDDPIYEEEAVEIFIAPGTEDPTDYFEFEVSPDGVLFDAKIHNPDSDRTTMTGDAAWDCEGIEWAAQRHDEDDRWIATLILPWRGLIAADAPPPGKWRANFFRIERPRDTNEVEYSCWRPTFAVPADFHKPACFGTLVLPD